MNTDKTQKPENHPQITQITQIKKTARLPVLICANLRNLRTKDFYF